MRVRFIKVGSDEPLRTSAKDMHIPRRDDKIIVGETMYRVEDVILNYDIMLAVIYITEA